MASSDDREFLAMARESVIEYLGRLGVRHGGVCDLPAWVLAPYVSLWAVRGGRNPATIGWFAIAGDLPTDYVSSNDARSVREAIRHFAREWLEVADCMERGVEHPGTRIGSPQTWPQLHGLLRSRATLLGEWASDDALWSEGYSDPG